MPATVQTVLGIAEIRPFDPADFTPGRKSLTRCTWGGNSDDDPCPNVQAYTVTDTLNRSFSCCEHHLAARRAANSTPHTPDHRAPSTGRWRGTSCTSI